MSLCNNLVKYDREFISMPDEVEDTQTSEITTKNIKCKRGERGKPIKYGEKTVKCNLSLTPTSKKELFNRAQAQGNSMSGILELWLQSDPSQLEKDYAVCQEQLRQAQATIAKLTEKILKLL